MSMTQTVVDLIDVHGPQSLNTIAPILAAEGVAATREQIKAAFSYARDLGKIVALGREPRTSSSRAPAYVIYAMAPDEPPLSGPPVFTPESPRPVASVWEMGTRAAQEKP